MFLIAKEFGVSIDEVKRWPLRKFFKHRIFLKEYFEQMNTSVPGKRSSSSTPVDKHKFQFK